MNKQIPIKTNVVVYARVSTLKQDYDRQVNELNLFSKKNDFRVLEIFSEKVSGVSSRDKRPEMNRMIKYIENKENKISKVLVWEISRLGRNPLQVKETLELITDLGISVYIFNSHIETLKNGKRDPVASLIISILSELGTMEREQTLQRIKSGLRESALKGKAGGGASLPYGFMKGTTGKLEINVNEAKVVKKIFEMSLSGKGTRVIANYLNEQNILTRGNLSYRKFEHHGKAINPKTITWSGTTVLGMLKNPIYKGERGFKDEVIPIELIIPREKWQAVQSKLKENYNQSSRNTRFFYLLKDVLKCSICGRNYVGRKRSTLKDNYYQCSSRIKGGGGCGNLGIGIKEIESAVWELLRKQGPVLNEISESFIKNDLGQDKRQLESEIELLEATQKKIRNEISKLIELTSKGIKSVNIVSKEIRKKEKVVEENDAQISILQLKRLSILNSENEKDSIKEVIKALKKIDSSAINKRLIIEKLIQKISITIENKENIILDVILNGNLESLKAKVNSKTKRIYYGIGSRAKLMAVYEYYD